MTLNACELEIDLFCRGMRVPDDVPLDGARGISRTRAGLGSGLEIAIPTGSRKKREIYTNVPVTERFAGESPYRLTGTLEASVRSGCHRSPSGMRNRRRRASVRIPRASRKSWSRAFARA